MLNNTTAISKDTIGKENSLYKGHIKNDMIELSKILGLKILSGCLMVAAKSLGQASYDIEKIITKHINNA